MLSGLINMRNQSRLNLGLASLLSVTAGTITITTTAQAQMPVPTQANRKSAQPTFKEQFDQHTRTIDETCNWQRYEAQRLGYSICAMKGVIMAVAMDGPEGDNGPTAYFQDGKLFAFRDTGVGTAQLFDKKGRLLAEVEVGTVAPEYNKITTKFTAVERKELTDRASESSQHLLTIAQQWQRSRGSKATASENAQCKLSRGCAYGPEVSDRWITAERLAAKADFDGAISEYLKAFEAAATLKLPGRTATQMKLLRTCATTSSLAHIEGLQQAKGFQEAHTTTAENHKMALEIYRDRVREVMEQQDTEFPELIGKCP